MTLQSQAHGPSCPGPDWSKGLLRWTPVQNILGFGIRVADGDHKKKTFFHFGLKNQLIIYIYCIGRFKKQGLLVMWFIKAS